MREFGCDCSQGKHSARFKATSTLFANVMDSVPENNAAVLDSGGKISPKSQVAGHFAAIFWRLGCATQGSCQKPEKRWFFESVTPFGSAHLGVEPDVAG